MPRGVPNQSQESTVSDAVSASQLAEAIREAIQAGKPEARKTIANRVKNTPWTPPPGVSKLKLKRKFSQHGYPITEKFLTNAQIDLANKLRPGAYCDGWVKVTRRRDKGIDIDYPVKTAAQHLKLVNSFGIRSLDELLQRCINEAASPKKLEVEDLD